MRRGQFMNDVMAGDCLYFIYIYSILLFSLRLSYPASFTELIQKSLEQNNVCCCECVDLCGVILDNGGVSVNTI